MHAARYLKTFDPVHDHLGEMDHVQKAAAVLNRLLVQNCPKSFSSAWVLRRAPWCYDFIRKHIRSDLGGIDWDRLTRALEPKYQRLWAPRQRRKFKSYKDRDEIDRILNKHRAKLYVFIAPADAVDCQIRDRIAVALVRVAQAGNSLARAELLELVRHTIDGWLDSHQYVSRWRGHEDEVLALVEGCIRRYRYSGSFLRYVFRTLEYAARGISSLCSLDEPKTIGARECKMDNVIRDPETNELVYYKPNRGWSLDSGPELDG